jgi:putative transposase
MPNTFSQIYLQFVFAVYQRRSLIPKEHKEEIHMYITELVKRRNSKLLAVNCMPDHLHLFVGFKPTISISDFVKEIKVETNQFINRKRWLTTKFSWQNGYGVFSYSQSHVDTVVKYVLRQEHRHRNRSFREEYREFLKKFEISFNEKYLFDFYE